MNLWERLLRPAHAPVAARARHAVDGLVRNLRVVGDGLRGRQPSPLVMRTLRARRVQPAATTAAATAREVRVTAIRQETADAITIVFEDPAGELAFTPGQFFTLLVDIDGEMLRRAYSASSSFADTARAAVTVKRVVGGRVSNHLHDHLRVGDALRVLGPSGDFTVAPEPERCRHVVLLGGGSGVTPLMAIARGLLVREPDSLVSLVVGNRSADDVIFAGELDALGAAYPFALQVRHVLEAPGGRVATAGRLDEAAVAVELEALGDRGAGLPTEYFVCGPAPMMAAARTALLARGVAPDAIREERFASPARPDVSRVATAQPVTLLRAGTTRAITVAPGATLLDAGLGAGVPMAFSCAMGGCGACAVELVEGAVELEEPNCLSAAERARAASSSRAWRGRAGRAP